MKRTFGFTVAAILIVVAFAWAQNTTRALNLEYNAEGTGNVLTLPFTIYKPAANCDASVGYNAEWYSNSTNDPTFACIAGSNVQLAESQFVEGATLYLWSDLFLPATWTSTIDLTIFWRTAATTNNVVWQVQTACAALTESIDPSWNTAQTVTDAADGNANRLNSATITGLTTTGCAAGEMFYFRILRDPAHASDTLGATASMLGAHVTYRLAI